MNPTLTLPDNQILTVDDIVVLRRYPGMTWTVNRGWYTYMSQQFNGWYFCSIPDQEILPIVDDDLIGIVIEQSNYESPDCGCNNNNSNSNTGGNNSNGSNSGNTGNGSNGLIPDGSVKPTPPPYYPPHHHPIVPPPYCPPQNSNTDIAAQFTAALELQLQKAFITVNSIAERDALVTNNKNLPHGKIVKVNSTEDRTTKYFTWNQIAEEWDIETFGLINVENSITKEECKVLIQEAISDFIKSTAWKQINKGENE